MAILTDAQLFKAAERFLAGNPEAAKRIAALTQADADFMETTLERLRLDRTMDEIDKAAREAGEDSMELRYSLVADTWEEFDKMRQERQARINQALGL